MTQSNCCWVAQVEVRTFRVSLSFVVKNLKTWFIPQSAPQVCGGEVRKNLGMYKAFPPGGWETLRCSICYFT